MDLPFATTPDGHPLVTAWLAGWLPCRFIVDTGAANSFIIDERIRKLMAWSRTARGHGGITICSPAVNGEPIIRCDAALGPLRLRNLTLVPLDRREFGATANEFDGLLGMDFLRAAAFLFDRDSRELELWVPAGLTPSEVRREFAGNPARVAIHLRDGRPFVDVGVNGGPGRGVLLDTGAVVTVPPLGPHATARLHPYARYRSYTARGPADYNLVVLHLLTIGNEVRIHRTVVGIPTPRSPRAAAEPRLGFWSLQGLRVLLDIPGGAMYVGRASGRAIPQVLR